MDLTLFTFLLGFGEVALPVSDLDLIFRELLIYELYLDRPVRTILLRVSRLVCYQVLRPHFFLYLLKSIP